jgi:hypothetical protein
MIETETYIRSAKIKQSGVLHISRFGYVRIAKSEHPGPPDLTMR